MEALLTTGEVAKQLGKKPHYIYANAERLGLPRVRIGKQYRYRPSEIEAWLNRQRADAT